MDVGPALPPVPPNWGFGNIWRVVSRVEEVSDDEIWKRLQDPVYAEAMRAAQETLDAELGGRRRRGSSAPVKPS